jgi:hypothetical protein
MEKPMKNCINYSLRILLCSAFFLTMFNSKLALALYMCNDGYGGPCYKKAAGGDCLTPVDKKAGRCERDTASTVPDKKKGLDTYIPCFCNPPSPSNGPQNAKKLRLK